MLRVCANISTLFTEWPMLDRFAAAADAGFTAVEIQFPYDATPDALAAARSAAGVETVLINMPAGRIEQGDLGLACRIERRAEFADSVTRATEYCDALRCGAVNCLSGKSDGEPDWATLADNLGRAAALLERHDIRLLVEPLNRFDHPDFLLHSIEDADALLDEVGHPNLAIQYDLYHMRASNAAWPDSFLSRLSRIGHVQFSDFPGRGPPGSGVMNFDDFFAVVRGSAYVGWAGAEYRPTGSTNDSFAWKEMAC